MVTVVVTVVFGISFINESATEIINGLPFVTDTPGLDQSAKTNVSHKMVRLGPTIRFARLIPVPDQTETEGREPLYEREVQHSFTIPNSYSPIFSERDLMRKLDRSLCREIIFYTITDEV